MSDEEKIQFWDDKPVGVSGGTQSLNVEYETRRQERIIGLACYGTLIDLQNFITYVDVYSWRGEDRIMIESMKETAQNYNAMKAVEQQLLQISDVFYAPIIPTETAHKIKNDE
jgi:hypothetical protein